ncbi:MAG TPA: PqqD family peptide modification chaperone [Blastocatellia bacterium]|nr:PqqD family peptide modification chaperone [Blastocatellia bacterium]
MKNLTKQLAPQARSNGLVVEELADEVLVYDLDRDRAHCLNQTAANVWRLCDGKSSPAEIAARLGVELEPAAAQEVVWTAIDQLGRAGLLDKKVKRPTPSISRRDVMKKIAVAAAIGVPAVTSVVAPKATHAATCRPSGQSCTASAQCCSGICNAGTCV